MLSPCEDGEKDGGAAAKDGGGGGNLFEKLNKLYEGFNELRGCWDWRLSESGGVGS